MRIQVTMLRKNRTIAGLKVKSEWSNFRYKGGIYNIDREAVALVAHEKTLGTIPELIFLEDRPSPIKSKTDPKRLLNQKLIEGAIKQSAKPKGQFALVLLEYARDPGKLLMLIFVLLIGGTILASFLGLA